MKAILTTLTFTVFLIANSSAFCGFYVAKAGAEIFNESSQVIIARNEGQTVVTMSNDFDGFAEEFAMIVPVPEVLKKDRIRIAEESIFTKMDEYSGPRLVEYFDQHPCHPMMLDEITVMSMAVVEEEVEMEDMSARDYGVDVLESYTVGEYDIVILSAEESDGLEKWLTKNRYSIPKGAADLLEPYVKNDMKFFVVKVNVEEFERNGFETLRPIQMTYLSDNFMLPIRLGMSNAKGAQDLIIHLLTENGKVECTNYRNVNIPTDKNIPDFVEPKFGQFYGDLFSTAWEKEGKNVVFTEYNWDLSSSNFVKCDPCNTTPPNYADLREAGVFWMSDNNQRGWGNGSDYNGDLFFTRLHVRYDRANFPQDLMFQETPDKKQFQGRYIINHVVDGKIDCEEAGNYYKDVVKRRKEELANLSELTGWETQKKYKKYLQQYEALAGEIKSSSENKYINRIQKNGFFPTVETNENEKFPSALYLLFGAMLLLVVFKQLKQ